MFGSVNSRQVAEMFMSRDRDGDSVLTKAAASGRKGLLGVVLGTLRKKLTDEQVCGGISYQQQGFVFPRSL